MSTVDEVVLPGAAPLGGLPESIDTKVVARIRAGLPPQSGDHPRRPAWRRVVVPAAILSVLDAVGSVVAFAYGHAVLATIALVLFVLLTMIMFRAARLVRTDPLRLDPAEREQVSLACGWRSTYSSGDAVATGAAAVGRVVACAAWWSPLLDEHRARLDLRRWLGGLDVSARDDPPRARERAAAMGEYAAGLEMLVTRHGAGEVLSAVPDELERLRETATASDRLSP